MDAGADDAPMSVDAPQDGDPGDACTAGEALSCTNGTLVRCKSDGSGEESVACALGCHATEIRCNDVNPSNGLATYLDQAAAQADLDLSGSTTIDTSTGEVKVNGTAVTVTSFVTGSAPEVRVLVVASLVAGDVTVTGGNALAIVSDGDVTLGGHLSVSAKSSDYAGPGALNDTTCIGKDFATANATFSGAGGGGFGTAGASGGNATNSSNGTVRNGGAGGGPSGNVTLTPLRGGCASGLYGNVRGLGGGAVQVVSRTKILVQGVISANGSSYAGGGSGGGILLEAPVVDVSGNVVANGGGGAGGSLFGKPGESGRLDDIRAAGGIAPDQSNGGNGGAGAAGAIGASSGASKTFAGTVYAGHGGGGVGRIRINTAPNGFTKTGIVSPNPSLGSAGVR